MVRAEDSHSRGRGFESRRILDGCKRIELLAITLKIENLKIKVAKWGTTKKNILKMSYVWIG